MKTKEEITDNLNNNIKDIKALMKDINSWDIYEDDNWESLIDNLNEAKAFINKKPKLIKVKLTENEILDIKDGIIISKNCEGTRVRIIKNG